jgi:sRNA-binding carbon storage regulator CsrA
VTSAIRSKIAEYTPDKADQFELLLQDQRSVRKMADLTLNDETIVTADNAPKLVELMRQAMVEDVQARATEEIEANKKKHSESQRKAREQSAKAHKENGVQ